MKDKIDIKDEKNLVGELLFYWETNRKPNCVADKYASINCRDSKVVSVLGSAPRHEDVQA